MRDGQTGKGAGKLLKSAFGQWTVPLAHTVSLLVRTGRDDRSGEKKPNNKDITKNVYALVHVCAFPSLVTRSPPGYGIIAPVAMVIRKFYLHCTIQL